MMNFFYYLRNKNLKKKQNAIKSKKNPFFLFFIFIWKWNDEEIKKHHRKIRIQDLQISNFKIHMKI